MQTEVGSEPICSSLAPAGTAAAVSPMCVRSRRGLACSTCGGSTFLLGGCDWSGRGLFIPIEGLQLVRRRGIFPLRGCDWSSGGYIFPLRGCDWSSGGYIFLTRGCDWSGGGVYSH
eukprot:1195691-Prorocentrum_minimum.AAC.5